MDCNALKEFFKVSEHIILFSVIAIGYPLETPVPRENFKAKRIHIGKY